MDRQNEFEIDALRERIAHLVSERQELRASGASRGSLERNRLQLVHRQAELSRALIRRHAPSVAV
jgi:hypothetical protein